MDINVIYATCKGNVKEHIYQDFIKVIDGEECLMAVVADGLGSATQSSRGSELICQIISSWANRIDWTIHLLPEVLNTAIMEWYRRLESKNVDTQLCCTTCSVVTINKRTKQAYICRIGDSPIFYRIDNGITQIIDSQKDFLNETDCIGSRKRPVFYIKEVCFKSQIDFLVCTDGFGDEVIPETTGALFDYFIKKYSKIKAKKRCAVLKKELITTLSNKNNDDKSLIFGWTS